jgi:hypothetical protein
MSFASVSGNPITGSGLNFPCELIKNFTGATLTLEEPNKNYTITTANDGSLLTLTLPQTANIGDWINVVYLGGNDADSITIVGTAINGNGAITEAVAYEAWMFVYSPIPLKNPLDPKAGWVGVAYW